jgi:hypothetical protein
MRNQTAQTTISRQEKKLDVYLQQTGIKNIQRAKTIIQQHFQRHTAQYPYVLFRDDSLYLFTVTGLREVKPAQSRHGVNYLRFDGKRITQLEAQYYLGPGSGTDAGGVFWGVAGESSNNNNNNNNNNNGNNNNNNG